MLMTKKYTAAEQIREWLLINDLFEPDWLNDKQRKYYLFYTAQHATIKIGSTFIEQRGHFYLSSEQLALKLRHELKESVYDYLTIN